MTIITTATRYNTTKCMSVVGPPVLLAEGSRAVVLELETVVLETVVLEAVVEEVLETEVLEMVVLETIVLEAAMLESVVLVGTEG